MDENIAFRRTYTHKTFHDTIRQIPHYVHTDRVTLKNNHSCESSQNDHAKKTPRRKPNWAYRYHKRRVRSADTRTNTVIYSWTGINDIVEKVDHIFKLVYRQSHSFISSISSYFRSGPLRPSWDIMTSITHSFMKNAIEFHDPLGKHSVFFVRFFTDRFFVPVNPFRVSITPVTLNVDGVTIVKRLVWDLSIRAEGKIGVPAPIIDTKASCTVKGEWVVDNNVTNNYNVDTETLVLFLHGGAYYFLSPKTHRGITSELSRRLKAGVFAVDYRLSPEHLFPSALEDALISYLYLLSPKVELDKVSIRDNLPETFYRNPQLHRNAKARRIFIAGDSSGGGLSLSLALLIRDLGLPLPAGVILLSPHLDAEFPGASWQENAKYDFMTPDLEGCREAMRYYANGDLDHPEDRIQLRGSSFLFDMKNPYISPIYGDFRDLPPILIQTGEVETLVDDSRALYSLILNTREDDDRAEVENIEERENEVRNNVIYEEYRDMFHVFHAFSFLAQSKAAFESIERFGAQIP